MDNRQVTYEKLDLSIDLIALMKDLLKNGDEYFLYFFDRLVILSHPFADYFNS